MSLNALLSNSLILAYHFLMLLRPAALSHFWAKSTVILVVQEQLFLWCKNSYSCGVRTVIIVVQEQLLLWYKNSYYYGTRTVIFMVQEQLFLWCKNNCCYIPLFFIVLDISVTLLSHIFRSFFALLDTFWKKIAVMDSYGHLWTVMDTLAFCDFVSLLCVKWGIWGPCSPISITTFITNSQYVGTSGRTRITWYRQLKINYIKTTTI